MRYIEFESKRFSDKSQETITQADSIINEYADKGYILTLRQLYYQFVARGLIENTERSYKNLGSLVTDARMAGLLPWDGIEDRAREHNSWLINEDMQSIFEDLHGRYAVDMWANQPYYVEVWVEKEALGNVVERPCQQYRVPYMACKGYLSASQAWRAGERFEEAIERGQQPVMIHLGDHDPSGIDMTRDNEDRLGIFSRSSVEVRRIALTMNQIRQYNPPPNPAKMTDTRATDYVSRYGTESWELDALRPEVIDQLIRDEITSLIDDKEWDKSVKAERKNRTMLRKLHANWDKTLKFMESL